MKNTERKNSVLPDTKNYFPVLIFSIIVFVLLPFVQYNAAIDPDSTPKFICFAILSSIFFIFFLFAKNHAILNFRQLFFLAVAFYLLAIHKSVNSGEAIYEFLQIAFPFIFLVIVTFIISISENAIVTILKFQSLAVVIFSCFGAVQLFSAYKVSVENNFHFVINYAISSTLGNKNFYSETLLLFFPLCISGAIILKRLWRILNIFSSILILISLLVLQTSSTLIAFVMAFVAALFFVFFFRNYFFSKQKAKQVLKFVSLILVFLSVIILLFLKSPLSDSIQDKIRNIEQIAAIDTKEQIESGDTRNANSVYERFLLWKNTYKLFQEKPFTGIGLANWKIFYPKYGIGGAYYLNSGVMHFEHPHNEYLLMLAERGLISLIGWIAINAIIIYYLIKILKASSDGIEKILSLAIFFGIISFAVISFFGYPMHRIYSSLLLMIMFGIAITYYNRHFICTKTISSTKMKFIFLFCFLICIYTSYVMAERLNGEVNMKKAFVEQSKNHFERMKQMVNKADSYYFKLDLTATPLNWYRGFVSNYIQQFDSALYYFKLAESENPYHIQILNDIGATLENNGKHDEAIAYLRRALDITPVYNDASLNLCIAYFNKGSIDSAYLIVNSLKVKNEPSYNKCLEAVLTSKAGSMLNQLTGQKLRNLLEQKITNKLWLRSVNDNCKKNNTTFENELLIELKELQN